MNTAEASMTSDQPGPVSRPLWRSLITVTRPWRGSGRRGAPGSPGGEVAPLGGVVDQGARAGGGLGRGVAAGLAVEEGVGGVAGPLEGHHALALVGAELRERTADVVGLAQVLDDLQLLHVPLPGGV